MGADNAVIPIPLSPLQEVHIPVGLEHNKHLKGHSYFLFNIYLH
jgi:hypothetical protein